MKYLNPDIMVIQQLKAKLNSWRAHGSEIYVIIIQVVYLKCYFTIM